MSSRIRVFAPATLSNLGPGFDVLGLALAAPGDDLEAEVSSAPGIELVEITGDAGQLPLDPQLNVAAVAARDLFERAQSTGAVAAGVRGVRLWLHKGIPIASGLGGSAASSVAGAVAVNELLGRPFTPLELVDSALAGERLAAVTPHGDNIIPCLLGGIVLIRTLAPLDVVQLPVPSDMHLAVVHPHCQVATAQARAILDDCRFQLADAVANTANIAAFVCSLYRNDLALLGRSIEDRLVEPRRAPLVPAFEHVKAAALEHGGLACSISGSGPTLFAVTRTRETATIVAAAMQKAFTERAGLASDPFVGQVNGVGARLIGPDR